MASVRDVRAAVVECCANGGLDACYFFDVNRSTNSEFPYDKHRYFNLESMDESECKAEFRFEKADIVPLSQILGVLKNLFVTKALNVSCSDVSLILVAIQILCCVFPDQFLNLA